MMLPLICSGCGKPWVVQKSPAKIILPNVQVKRGDHCESAAMLNAMRYLGYPVNETMIVGGGGALGFDYQKGIFPFLGARSQNMREVFAGGSSIKWHAVKPATPEESWEGVVELLQRGIPVVLRVDMRYLPYRYGGKYGPSYMSFGWHMITLFGMDLEKGMAYVSDREYDTIQAIRLQDLDKARASKTKVFPPCREFSWVEPMPQNYKLNWDKLTRNAVHQLVQNLEPSSSGLGGLNDLKALPDNIRRIETYATNRWLLPAIFSSLHGYIEDFGTGGAAFRIMVRDFFEEASGSLTTTDFEAAITALNESITAWHGLSGEFETISKQIKNVQTKSARDALYNKAAEQAEILYKKESSLLMALKKIDKSQE